MELLLLNELLQVSDDRRIAELFGGVFDAEVGEGAAAFFGVVEHPEDAVFRLHGDRQFMQEIDADAKHFGGAVDCVDMGDGGHDQAAAASGV